MAATIENSNGNSSVSSTSLSVTLTITSANKLIAIVGAGNSTNPEPTSVTWNGAALTKIAGVYDANWCGVSAWYLDSPAAGSYSVVFDGTNFANAAQQAAMVCGLLTAETGAPAYNTGTPTSGSPSVSVAGSVSGDLMLGGIFTDDNAGITPTETQIYEVEDIASDTAFNSSYKSATGSSESMTWSQDSSLCAVIALAVGGSSSGSGAPRAMRHLMNMMGA